MSRTIASLSLDLDNKWSYLKTRGDDRWETLPSYLDFLVPRILETFERRGLTATFFVVGIDAEQNSNHDLLKSVCQSGHEIGNHSYRHEPWLHEYTREEIKFEFDCAEQAIESAIGFRPVGFRGPGYSLSDDVLLELTDRHYLYDASTLPSLIGPAARLYYRLTSGLSREERKNHKQTFGTMRDGLRSLCAYRWPKLAGDLLEIPVTTHPLARTPIHFTYLSFLSRWSQALSIAYFRSAITSCRLFGIAPSILLHPLDFLGGDEDKDLGFFPGMDIDRDKKLDLLNRMLDVLQNTYELVPMHEHANYVLARSRVAKEPDHRERDGQPASKLHSS